MCRLWDLSHTARLRGCRALPIAYILSTQHPAVFSETLQHQAVKIFTAERERIHGEGQGSPLQLNDLDKSKKAGQTNSLNALHNSSALRRSGLSKNILEHIEYNHQQTADGNNNHIAIEYTYISNRMVRYTANHI